MAQRTHHSAQTSKSEVINLFAKLVGAGAADLVVQTGTDTNGPDDIVSATRTGVGTFTIVFRHKYPKLIGAPVFSFVTTSGQLDMSGTCTAIDVAAGTATFAFGYSTTPADPAATDAIYVTWAVRNTAHR